MAFNTAGAAQGAAAGSAAGPWGAAVGGLVGGFAGGGGGSSGAGGGVAPQNAESAIYGGTGLDASGWNVNFSGMQTNGSNKSAPSGLESVGLGSGGVSPFVIAAVVAVVGMAIWKKKSK